MEEGNNEVIIDVKINAADVAQELAETNKSIAELTERNKDLTKAIRDNNDATGRNAKELAENNAKIKELKATQSTYQGQLNETTKQSRKYGDSIKQMTAQLNDMKDRYRSLDAEMRDSEGGKELLRQIQDLDKQVKDANASIGNFQMNVGNYKSALEGIANGGKAAAEGFEVAGIGTDKFKKALDILRKNPMILLLTVIVTTLTKLKDKMGESSTATASLHKATASLKPLMEGLEKVVSKLADVFSNVLDWAIENTIAAIGKLGNVLKKVGGWFGKDWGGALIEDSDNMKAARAAAEQIDETMSDTADSIGKAADAVERLAAALIDALPALKQFHEAGDKFKAEQLKTKYETTQDAIEGLRQQFAETDAAILDVNHALAMVPESLGRIEPSTFEKMTAAMENYKNTIAGVSAAVQSSFGSIADIYAQMAADESRSEEEREEAAKASKRWSMMQVATNSAVALSQSIAAASAAGGFPANLVAISSSVATVLGFIAQARSMMQGFEHGGIIGGNSYTGDNVNIRANSSEMVLTRQQQRTLFDIANGAAVTSTTESLVNAIKAMPAPVLVYKEFSDFQSNVAKITNIQEIK